MQKVAIDVAASVRNAGSLVKQRTDYEALLSDEYHIAVTDNTDGSNTDEVLRVVYEMLDNLADSGPAVKRAIEGMGLLTLILDPGEHIQQKNEQGQCYETHAFADYEKTQASLRIATDLDLDAKSEVKVGMYEHNVGTSFRDVLAHEIGHLCMEDCEQAACGKFRIVYDMQPSSYWHTKVSEYAAKDDHELFAECFSAFTSVGYEGNLPDEVVEFFNRAGVMPRVRKARRGSTADDAVEAGDWETITDALKDYLEEQFEHAAKVEISYSDSEISFDIVNEEAVAYAEDRAAELVTGIKDTTRDSLRSMVASAIEDGDTNSALADSIMDAFAFSKERADMIARTELAMADTAGHMSIAKQAGAVGKRWLLSNDDPCDECTANAEEDVIAFDELFQSGDDVAPAHPNCCCDFQAVYADDPDAEDLLDDEDDADKIAKIHKPRIRIKDDKYQVVDTDGHVYGTHSSRNKARRQVRALYANKLDKAQVDAAANEAATSSFNYLDAPTPKQVKAGNYKKGHIQIAGMDITIENPAYSVRRGISPQGVPWCTTLTHHYGYIRRTEGADGDHLDVLVRNGLDEDYMGDVFIVDQYIDGEFDEHKCLIGWNTELAARNAYMEQYQTGWKGLGAITQMTMDEFIEWSRSGNLTLPVSDKTVRN